MPGRPGQPSAPASFVFETDQPAAQRKEFFAHFRTFAGKQWREEIAHEIELILEEWITDVLSYGMASFLSVKISSDPNTVKIIVTDNGQAFDPTKHPEPDLTLPPEDRPIGGLGIFMIRNLSTALHYARTNDRNVLTIEKNARVPALGGTESAAMELPISSELDLHTFRPSDLGDLLPDYLEACRAKGILEVRVIHGKGIGNVKRSVEAILRRLDFVERFAPASAAFGGLGATMVYLKARVVR